MKSNYESKSIQFQNLFRFIIKFIIKIYTGCPTKMETFGFFSFLGYLKHPRPIPAPELDSSFNSIAFRAKTHPI